MSSDKIRVLVIDDSAFARKVIREVLEKDPLIDVIGIAHDGLDALEKIAILQPDVITLDLVMPDLDGLGVLRALPKISTAKALVVSVSGSNSEIVIDALHLGAVDVVQKPTAFLTDRLYDMSEDLIAKVKAAAEARPRTESEIKPQVSKVVEVSLPPHSGIQLIVLGTSTGGPQAITELFKTLPADLPVPLVIALHIPSGYTQALAARISQNSALKLVEASNGMKLLPGRAYIAPGGMHLMIEKEGNQLFCVVSLEPKSSLYHPSIDLMFESAAKKVGSGVLGVILTGMGCDGTQGALAIRKAGGQVLAESAESCVVYGMPRAAMESGAVNEQANLEAMSRLIRSALSR